MYEILSHKNWGASSTILNEIARDSFDYDKFALITQLMWESMENQRPAAWRIVFKGLSLLEHLIKNGSERCVDDARNHGHTLRSLHQFNYYEGTIDRGLGVREKSKQLVELLSDDERIREERQKARKLREKFGGNLGGTGSGGGGGGGQYAGYGNDNWNSGGYGDSGIGSNGGGGYGNSGGSRFADNGGGSRGGSYDEDENKGYSGRYNNEDTAATPAPTFASLPDDPPKKTKGKKKKKKDGFPQPAAAAPAVDLFSFDDAAAPTPVANAAGDDEDFAGFQSASGPAPAAADPFAAPPAPQAGFNAFAQQPQQQEFGSFAAAPQQNGDMFAGSMQQPSSSSMMNGANNVMGGNMMGGGAPNNVMGGSANVMGGGMPSSNTTSFSAAPTTNDDDDFGDFAGAGSNGAAAPAAAKSTDPLAGLISLDGLSKNSSKSKDKLSEPIIANAAAASFIQEKDQIQASIQQAAKGNSMSFAGLDGLNSQTGGASMGMPMMSMNMSQPAMGGMNPSVMGGGGATSSAIGMLDPSMMQQQQSAGMMNPQQHQQQQQGMMMNQGMNPQMMGNMSGQMNPGMQQQGFAAPQGAANMGGMYNNQSMGMQGNAGQGMPMVQNPGMNGFNTMQQTGMGNQMGGFR